MGEFLALASPALASKASAAAAAALTIAAAASVLSFVASDLKNKIRT